jgi:hypothetical protein
MSLKPYKSLMFLAPKEMYSLCSEYKVPLCNT